jgi:hypothetical protein
MFGIAVILFFVLTYAGCGIMDLKNSFVGQVLFCSVSAGKRIMRAVSEAEGADLRDDATQIHSSGFVSRGSYFFVVN